MTAMIPIDGINKIFSSEKFRLLLIVTGGIISGLPFLSDGLFIIEWICLVPFIGILILNQQISSKKAFLYGFLFWFSKSVIVFTWFKELYLMTNLDIPSPVMILLIILVIPIVSAITSIPFAICTVLSAKAIHYCKNKVFAAVTVSAFLTFSELIASLSADIPVIGAASLPWTATYVTQTSFLPAIQSASILGAYFVSFIIYLVNTLIAHAILGTKQQRILCLALTFVVFFLNILFGVACLNQDTCANDSLSILLYQDNNSSYDKWAKPSIENYDIFEKEITEYANTNGIPDVILTSESFFTTFFRYDPRINGVNARYIHENISLLSQKLETVIICGTLSADQENNKYNSLFLFENGLVNKTVYNKRNLVPFGEYLPKIVVETMPLFKKFNLSNQILTEGNKAEVFETEKAKIGAIICFDSLFYKNVTESVKNGAQVIVLSTNDSWYNDSAAINQHYAHAVFRAIENRRTVIRCAATGISGIIDRNGITTVKGGILEKDIICGNADISSEVTPFTKNGYTYFYILFLICTIYTATSCIKYKKQWRKLNYGLQSKNNITA